VVVAVVLGKVGKERALMRAVIQSLRWTNITTKREGVQFNETKYSWKSSGIMVVDLVPCYVTIYITDRGKKKKRSLR